MQAWTPTREAHEHLVEPRRSHARHGDPAAGRRAPARKHRHASMNSYKSSDRAARRAPVGAMLAWRFGRRPAGASPQTSSCKHGLLQEQRTSITQSPRRSYARHGDPAAGRRLTLRGKPPQPAAPTAHTAPQAHSSAPPWPPGRHAPLALAAACLPYPRQNPTGPADRHGRNNR